MAVKTFTDLTTLPASDINTYLANSGLVFVKETTIGAGVTSVPVDNCFPLDYSSFRIIIENNNTNGSASHTVQLQGITTTNYYVAGHIWAWTVAASTVAYSPSPQPNFVLSANTATGSPTHLIIDITNPNVAARKFGWCAASGGNGAMTVNMLSLSTATTTGFTISKGGDTMTGGTVKVYGYRNP